MYLPITFAAHIGRNSLRRLPQNDHGNGRLLASGKTANTQTIQSASAQIPKLPGVLHAHAKGAQTLSR